MKSEIIQILNNKNTIKVITCIHLIITIIIWFQLSKNPEKYNNYSVFRSSYFHLVQGKDLYIEYPSEHSDVFLYNPVFSILFAPFSLLPVKFGLLCWLLFNTWIILFSIKKIELTKAKTTLIYFLLFFGLSTNIRYCQSNSLIAALMIFSFVSFEKNENFKSSLFSVLGFCIKGVGGIVGLLFINYSNKWKIVLNAIILTFVISLLPGLFVGFDNLIIIYKSWFDVIIGSNIIEHVSLAGFCEVVLGWSNCEIPILIFGAFLLITFIISQWFRSNELDFDSRFVSLIFLLIWIVLFNRASESATYFIGLLALYLWFVNTSKSRINICIFIFAFIIIAILPSDLAPKILKNIQKNYVLKPVALLPVLLSIYYNEINLSLRKYFQFGNAK